MQHYLGIDIGGTNIKIGIVSEQGQAVANDSFSTNADAPAQAAVDNIRQHAQQLAAKAGMPLETLAGAGIGCPGPLDLEKGIVNATPNLKQWDHVPLRDMISRATGLPAILENDANAAAFGEFWAGAGRGDTIKHMVMVTLGTGIGSGIIEDGHIIHGLSGFAGEAGHLIIQPDGRPCGCGQKGCIEAYASAANLGRIAQERAQSRPDSALAQTLKQKGRVSSKDVFEQATQGDPLAMELVEQTTNYLAIFCVNLCRVLDPQMIVFAGGMILAGDALFNPLRQAFARQTWKLVKEKVTIVPAELGNDAGFIGAAVVAMDGHKRNKLVKA